MSDLISRRDAMELVRDVCDAIMSGCDSYYDTETGDEVYKDILEVDAILKCNKEIRIALKNMPSAQPEKEIPRRVLWSGWKGTRYTRYKCPNCNKPVKNDDVYCHRCGQKLMFPHISHTPYIEGQKQELIVRWEHE